MTDLATAPLQEQGASKPLARIRQDVYRPKTTKVAVVDWEVSRMGGRRTIMCKVLNARAVGKHSNATRVYIGRPSK